MQTNANRYIYIEVFKYIDSYSLIKTCSSVCKLWNKIIIKLTQINDFIKQKMIRVCKNIGTTGNIKFLKYLIKNKIMSGPKFYTMMLSLGCSNKSISVIKYCLDNYKYELYYLESCYRSALLFDHVDVVKVLINYIDPKINSNKIYMLNIVAGKQYECLKILCEYEAITFDDINHFRKLSSSHTKTINFIENILILCK